LVGRVFHTKYVNGLYEGGGNWGGDDWAKLGKRVEGERKSIGQLSITNSSRG